MNLSDLCRPGNLRSAEKTGKIKNPPNRELRSMNRDIQRGAEFIVSAALTNPSRNCLSFQPNAL